MGVVLAFLLSICIPFCVSLLPEDQPGCVFRPAMSHFFGYNSNLQPDTENWLCNESFVERLKICVDVYQRTTTGKMESSYEIIKDKESVSKECEKRKMTFTQVFDPSEPAYVANETIKNVTIQVNMFACPITKMDLQFPDEDLKPELYDIYISLSRNDVSIAVLRDSTHHVDNICVKDAYLYPPPHLRNKPRTKPHMPEELRDYQYMNDEYFEGLANRLIDRKAATATGAEISFYSTMFFQFTRPNNETESPQTTSSIISSENTTMPPTTSSIVLSKNTTISQTAEIPETTSSVISSENTTTISVSIATLESTIASTGVTQESTLDSLGTVSQAASEMSTLPTKKPRGRRPKSTLIAAGGAASTKAKVTRKATSKKATNVTKKAVSRQTKVTNAGATKPVAKRTKKAKPTPSTVSTVSVAVR